MFKVIYKDTRTTPLALVYIFIVNFEHISHLMLVFLLLSLNMQLLPGISLSNQMQYFLVTLLFRILFLCLCE